jgi:hypothetical protein
VTEEGMRQLAVRVIPSSTQSVLVRVKVKPSLQIAHNPFELLNKQLEGGVNDSQVPSGFK